MNLLKKIAGMLSSHRHQDHTPQIRQWNISEAEQPWFNQPNALELLDKKRSQLSERDATLLEKWVADGYFVVSDIVPENLLDQMAADLENVWTTDVPFDGLVLADLRHSADEPCRNYTHAELVKLPYEERQVLKSQSHWRTHEFFKYSAAANEVHNNEEMTRLASLIMGMPTNAEYTINFMYGSRQKLHQDSAVFHLYPPHYLAGTWLALEDIHPESGPLIYYPGSHREPFFPEFDNYPQTNLKTASKDRMARYQNYVDTLSEKYEKHQFLAKKGDILFWHGMLIHGGDAVIDPTRTRNSYVCHYVPPGMKQDHNIVGPFNW